VSRANRIDAPEFFGAHRITVSATTRRGRKQLHRFASGERTEWEPYHDGPNVGPVPVTRSAPWIWVQGGTAPGRPLREIRVAHLADGVDVSTQTLTFILDALRHASRHHVDLQAIRLVVSQLGSRISGIGELPSEPPMDGIYRTLADGSMERLLPSGRPSGDAPVFTREAATRALYREIVMRCAYNR